ncbi:hypothetical protein GCM10010435_26720 [Winogradskya consettensis]|uniref:Uncharacterized protein n=1 Tax=Winogradskya consettensis TaxID=113560 RepID=A0A919SAW5_9ACTN|nr:hypothetical protein [Actinoplanes consettensis]GIM68157.1 hypothetical protein Aco04nite_09510 [Actinoplanes consettensis]
MGSESGLVGDREGYRRLRAYASATFDLSTRFPDIVFRRPGPVTLFCQFDSVLGEDFWPALSELARLHDDDDDDVIVIVIEPDGEDHHFPRYGWWPAFSMSTGAGIDDYSRVILEPPTGAGQASFLLSGDIVAVTGPSGKWGIWGERDAELAAVQASVASDVFQRWGEEFGPFLPAVEAVTEYLPPNFNVEVDPLAYVTTLVASYQPDNSPSRR